MNSFVLISGGCLMICFGVYVASHDLVSNGIMLATMALAVLMEDK